MRVAALARGLVAVRPPPALIETVRPGSLLQLDAGERAAVLCQRAGLCVAAPLGAANAAGADDAARFDGSEAAFLGSDARLEVGFGWNLFGRALDWRGAPLDGRPPPDRARMSSVAAFGVPPLQADLKPIESSLHTGIAAIDALAPIGRGQSMLVLGERGTGKSAIGADVLLAQAVAADGPGGAVHCVLALSSPGAEHAARTWRELGGAEQRLLVLAPRTDSPAEAALVSAAACAVGESVRDSGGHALVVMDESDGPLRLWDEVGDALGANPAIAPGFGAAPHAAELRAYLASVLLQRAAQLSDERGGARRRGNARTHTHTRSARAAACACVHHAPLRRWLAHAPP